jgi:hypothetical protein
MVEKSLLRSTYNGLALGRDSRYVVMLRFSIIVECRLYINTPIFVKRR